MNGIGGNLFETLQGMLNGNVGFAVGLLIVAIGILNLAMSEKKAAGLVMILGGALVTLAPGVFNAARNLVADVLANVGADHTTSNFQTTPRL